MFFHLFKGRKAIPELEEARKKLRMGLVQEAIPLILTARTKSPGKMKAEVSFYLAVAYYMLKDRAMTERAIMEVLEKSPPPHIIWRVTELIGNRCLSPDKYVNTHPSFSRDGRRILFASAREDTNGSGGIDAEDNRALYSIDRSGREEYQIISNQFDNSYPSFSPDSRRVLFLSRRRATHRDGKIDRMDNAGIYLVDSDGKNERCLVPEVFPNKYPSFSPDGRKIVFTSGRGSCFGLYLYDLTTGKEYAIDDKYDYTFPSFSPDGKLLLYASWRRDTNGDGRIDIRDNSGIYVRNLEFSKEWVVASDRYNNSFPVFSSDGRKILYLSRRRDTNGDGKIDSMDNCGIYCCNLDGSDEQCIVGDEYYNKFASWSPDNSRIAFLSSKRGEEEPYGERSFFENKAIYTITMDGREEKLLVSARYQGNKFPLFSPVHDEVVYLSWRGQSNRGLYLVSARQLPSKEEIRGILKNLSF